MKKLLYISLLAVLTTAAHAEAPYIAPEDDPEYFGDPDNILFWTPEQKVAGFRNQDAMYPVRRVPRGEHVLKLSYQQQNLGTTRFEYQGRQLSIDDYFRDYNTAGLLVIKDGVIRYERYGLGNSAHTRWISWSVAKSVTSLLLGAAIQDGYINSVDEKVTDYLPRLKGSAYEQVTIRNILQMTSGVAWDETYSDPDSDINRANWQTLALYEHLRQKPRVAPPGKVFNYSTAETNLVGNLLRAAIGNNLSTYLSDKIWQPFGMEKDATWQLVAPGDGEYGGSSLSATLRDYGRIGLFALSGGTLTSGAQVLPHSWLASSTSSSSASERYGYLWWLGAEGVYEASGIFGQSIYINPRKNVVIAQHSAREQANKKEDWDAQAAAFRALTAAVSK